MTKVNKDFIKAMQKRLDEKESIFVGNFNYKNMSKSALQSRLADKQNEFWNTDSKHDKKILVDIANFCWMLWEKENDK